MNVEKTEIIATLRSRGLDARADWVDRQLPSIVDTYTNGALLNMLHIDPADLSPVEPVDEPEAAVAVDVAAQPG